MCESVLNVCERGPMKLRKIRMFLARLFPKKCTRKNLYIFTGAFPVRQEKSRDKLNTDMFT